LKRSLKIAAMLLFCALVVMSASAAPKTKDAVNLTVYSCPSTLDPQTASLADDLTVITQIYDCLFEFEKMDIKSLKPCLAESYETSNNGMVYTFRIRKGVKFHNGDELTADDVAFSLNRFTTSPSTSVYATSWKGAEVVDRYTAKLTLKYPAPLLLELLAWVNTGIVNKKAVEQFKGTNKAVVGTGAYKLKEWNSGESVVLAANESYFKGSPRIKTASFIAKGDSSGMAVAFMARELDFTAHLAAVDANNVKTDKNFSTITVQRSMTRLIAINNAVPALKDLRVRQALNYAVDSQAVNQMASEGVHSPANQYTPPMSEGYSKDVAVYPHNVAKAKELLAQAGYTKDRPLVLNLTYISEGVISRIATAVQAMLQDAGVQVKAVPLETQAWYEAMLGRKFDLGYFEGVCSPIMSFVSYYAFFNSKGYYNISNFNDPEVDKWTLGAMYDVNATTRVATEKAIAKRIAEQAVLIPIYYMNQVIAFDKNLKGVYAEPVYAMYKIFDMHWE
jgi:peptide/nickel transport system substrate-binding protein